MLVWWRQQSKWKAPSRPWGNVCHPPLISFRNEYRAPQDPHSETSAQAYSLGAKRGNGILQMWIAEICLLCWWNQPVFWWWWSFQPHNPYSGIAGSRFPWLKKKAKKATLLTSLFLLQKLQDISFPNLGIWIWLQKHKSGIYLKNKLWWESFVHIFDKFAKHSSQITLTIHQKGQESESSLIPSFK